MSTIRIKSTLTTEETSEIRRISIETRSFSTLRETLLMSHGIDQAASFTIKYKDEEGDLIFLSTDQDLEEALRVSKNTGNVLRIVITVSKPEAQAQPKGCQRSCSRKCPATEEQQTAHPHYHRRAGGCRRKAWNQFKASQSPKPSPAPAQPAQPSAQAQQCQDLMAFLPTLLQNVMQNPALKGIAQTLIGSNFVKFEHANIICDGCDSMVVGTRYKSTTQPDFDFCSECHTKLGASSGHSFEEIDPLTAILNALANGANPLSFLEAELVPGAVPDDKAAIRHNAICDHCNNRIVGTRRRCLVCPDFDVCNSCHNAGARAKGDHAAEHALFELRTNCAEERREYEKAKKEATEVTTHNFVMMEPVLAVAPAPTPAPAPVVKSAPAPVQVVAAPAEEKPRNAFERNLETLTQMGFTDRAVCIKALVKARNQLPDAIQALLAQ